MLIVNRDQSSKVKVESYNLLIQVLLAIDDYAKDGGKELLTKMHCVLIKNP